MAAAINMRAPIACGYSLSGVWFAMQRINHAASRTGQESAGRCHADRTPRVSSEPEWAAREKTQPAHGSPCATGLACQRGTRASGGRVVRATPRRYESLPPGALGGVLMVFRVSTQSCARSRAGLHSRSVRRDTFKASPGEA